MLDEYFFNNNNHMFSPIAKIIGVFMVWFFVIMAYYILYEEAGSFSEIQNSLHNKILSILVFVGGIYMIVQSLFHLKEPKDEVTISENDIVFIEDNNEIKVNFNDVAETKIDLKEPTDRKLACEIDLKTKSGSSHKIQIKKSVHYTDEYFVKGIDFFKKKLEIE
ncbi:MAG: hypothetical protein DWQ06_07650 [Calditrichaeota bacterium]|nr:MAG: hypothetical protein DWQ06_07650 [Calditrichota bacterium]